MPAFPWMEVLAVILPAVLLTVILGSIGLITKLRREKGAPSVEKDCENEEKETARKKLGKERVGKERKNVQ